MKSRMALVLLFVFPLVVFNLVYFWLVSKMSASRWVCWSAIHIAAILFGLAAHSATTTEDGLVHAYPKMNVALHFFLVMVGAGIVFTLFNPSSWRVPAVILTILGATDFFVYIALMSAEEASAATDRRQAAEVRSIREVAAPLDIARRDARTPGMRKLLESAWDAVRTAQVRSSPAVATLETRIADLTAQLGRVADVGDESAARDLANQLIRTIRDREAILRSSR